MCRRRETSPWSSCYIILHCLLPTDLFFHLFLFNEASHGWRDGPCIHLGCLCSTNMFPESSWYMNRENRDKALWCLVLAGRLFWNRTLYGHQWVTNNILLHFLFFSQYFLALRSNIAAHELSLLQLNGMPEYVCENISGKKWASLFKPWWDAPHSRQKDVVGWLFLQNNSL